MKRMLNTNKKGFTLIELIVVIAVIGILVLLAAPRFLGYTRDAHVSAMKADAKIISNAALVYHIDKEVSDEDQAWPVAYDGGKISEEGSKKVKIFGYGEDGELEETAKGTVTLFPIDGAKLNKQYIKNLKNDLSNYMIVLDGDIPELAGDVIALNAVEDRAGLSWVGVDLQNEQVVLDPAV